MFRTTPKFGLGGLEGGELWLGHGAKRLRGVRPSFKLT